MDRVNEDRLVAAAERLAAAFERIAATMHLDHEAKEEMHALGVEMIHQGMNALATKGERP